MTNEMINQCIAFMIESIGDEMIDAEGLNIDLDTIAEFGYDTDVWAEAMAKVQKAFRAFH